MKGLSHTEFKVKSSPVVCHLFSTLKSLCNSPWISHASSHLLNLSMSILEFLSQSFCISPGIWEFHIAYTFSGCWVENECDMLASVADSSHQFFPKRCSVWIWASFDNDFNLNNTGPITLHHSLTSGDPQDSCASPYFLLLHHCLWRRWFHLGCKNYTSYW